MSKSSIVILHGIAASPGAHWQQWLANDLAAEGHVSYLVDLPNSSNPNRIDWLDHICIYAGCLEPEKLIIVGHSLGVVTALDYIERASGKVRGLVAVAGFAHNYGSELNERFLASGAVDFAKVRNRLADASVVFGTDDPYVPQGELTRLATDLGVEPHVIGGAGHLNAESGYAQFPYVRDEVLRLAG